MKNYTCDRCKKVITGYDTVWTLTGKGNYGSQFDGESLHKHFCDSCLYNFINGGGKNAK